MENWKSHYFWGHIACVLFYVVVSRLPDAPKQYTPTPGKADLVDIRGLSSSDKSPSHLQQNSTSGKNRQDIGPQAYELEMKYS